MSDLPNPGSCPSPHGGSAALLLVLLMLVVLGFVAYLWLLPVSAPPGPGPAPVTQTPTESRTSKSAERPAAPAPTAEDRVVAAAPATGPRRVDDSNRFHGRGSLRGSVDTTVGKDFPATWTLILEPSRALTGREGAVAKRIEFTGDEREFEVPDLPLAGYAVRAEAPGYNGLPVHVLLERTSSSAYVMLQLGPAGFLTGRLNGSTGEPLEGIPVWLFDGAAPPAAQVPTGGRKTYSLADGTWRFDVVLDGPHTLVYGTPTAPMVAPVELQFHAPSLTVPRRTFRSSRRSTSSSRTSSPSPSPGRACAAAARRAAASSS